MKQQIISRGPMSPMDEIFMPMPDIARRANLALDVIMEQQFFKAARDIMVVVDPLMEHVIGRLKTSGKTIHTEQTCFIRPSGPDSFWPASFDLVLVPVDLDYGDGRFIGRRNGYMTVRNAIAGDRGFDNIKLVALGVVAEHHAIMGAFVRRMGVVPDAVATPISVAYLFSSRGDPGGTILYAMRGKPTKRAMIMSDWPS